jgi:hypothetical protein
MRVLATLITFWLEERAERRVNHAGISSMKPAVEYCSGATSECQLEVQISARNAGRGIPDTGASCSIRLLLVSKTQSPVPLCDGCAWCDEMFSPSRNWMHRIELVAGRRMMRALQSLRAKTSVSDWKIDHLGDAKAATVSRRTRPIPQKPQSGSKVLSLTDWLPAGPVQSLVTPLLTL